MCGLSWPVLFLRRPRFCGCAFRKIDEFELEMFIAIFNKNLGVGMDFGLALRGKEPEIPGRCLES